ncbi:MAG: exo-alpha-sialidase [Bacteroidetes bacterium]|nr:exo-alpha-sialidase [Bacteroidota bacterium]
MKKNPLHSLRLVPALGAAVLLCTGLACQKHVTPSGTSAAATDPVVKSTNATQTHTYSILFDGGTGGYHSYRIPSIVRTNSNALIAFCEGRMSSNADYGNINLVYKRSTDNGVTWSSLMQVAGAGLGTYGNPTAVVDRSTGRIWLFMSWNDSTHNQSGTDGYLPINQWGQRRVYVSHSDDDGLNWSAISDMTSTLLPSNYKWDAMGPGVGIYFHDTLFIPAIGRNIYSADHGSTWHYAMTQTGTAPTSEATIIDLIDGRLMRNDRATSASANIAQRRWVARGTIAGGFSTFAPDDVLLDEPCEGSIMRYTGSPDRIVFLNSASTVSRGKMRVRISYDGGQTWPISRRIYDWLSEQDAIDQGKGGYSSMVKTADYTVGALIEENEDVPNSSTSHRSISFHKWNLPWMLNGATEP